MSDVTVSYRVTTISGAKIKYTYDKANREVVILNARPTWGEAKFIAECWDSAPREIAERLGQADLAPASPQDLVDYLVHSHRNGYAMIPAMRTVRKIAKNDRDTLLQVNALFDKYISGLPNGWQLVPTGRTINGLLDDLGSDLPSVR